MSLALNLRHALLTTSARFLPGPTAHFLAKRYLCASGAFVAKEDSRNHAHSVISVHSDLFVLRHAVEGITKSRVLIIPGHDGRYRQFLRLTRDLSRAGVQVDILVPRGHMDSGATTCSLREFVSSILEVAERLGPYDGMIAHCVSCNSLILALPQGLNSPKIVLFSMPVDLVALAQQGGKQYGLDGTCLCRFIDHVNALNAPYPLQNDLRPIAASRTEEVLLVHSNRDWAAPVDDAAELADYWPGARMVRFDRGGHNEILTERKAAAEVCAFLAPEATNPKPDAQASSG